MTAIPESTSNPQSTGSSAMKGSPESTGSSFVKGSAPMKGSAARHATTIAVTGADEPSIGQLVHEASESVSTIVRGEIELAKLELRSSVKNAGVGVGMFAAAGVLLVFSLTFGLIALAEGLVAIGLWRWLAYLIVFVLLLLIVGLLAFLGFKKVKRVKAPQQTIDTGKDTVAYLKSHPKTTP